ncbi:cysteine protease YraA [Acrasis kona]|uniref:Cysteine protease YraA n=1 Tax=Acrasis kona TaxID=1008807 RepID=A0AAW2ZRH7_9EUKA
MAGRLNGKKVAMFVEYNYEDLEVHYPLIRLEEEGAQVVTIGPEKDKKFTGKHGYPVTSKAGIGEVNAKDYDALVIPGGFAPDYWRRDKRYLQFVKDIFDEKKPLAAICHGPWMLCSAKILKDQNIRCTSFIAIKDDVENAGGVWEDSAVVVDRNVITSRTPQDLTPFCKAIIEALSS